MPNFLEKLLSIQVSKWYKNTPERFLGMQDSSNESLIAKAYPHIPFETSKVFADTWHTILKFQFQKFLKFSVLIWFGKRVNFFNFFTPKFHCDITSGNNLIFFLKSKGMLLPREHFLVLQFVFRKLKNVILPREQF